MIKSSFRYNQLQLSAIKLYRLVFPVPKSPWTKGRVHDICEVNLVPPETLKKFYKNCFELLQKLKGPEIGDYLEFGVFNGSSISSAFLTAKENKIHTVRFFGFDAFQGLPAGSEKEDDGVWEKGFYACSFEQLTECLRRKNIDPNEIVWIKGWYNETLKPETVDQYKINNLSIVFIDCDTYSSSKMALDFIAPLITEPVIICLDDWKLNDLDIKGLGEYKSFNEFLEDNTHLKATEIPSYNRKSKSFLITI